MRRDIGILCENTRVQWSVWTMQIIHTEKQIEPLKASLFASIEGAADSRRGEDRQSARRELKGSSAPAVVPGIAPVLRGAFGCWQDDEGGCADDAAGSARPLLRDLLMAEWVFDDSCKNPRLRVSFTAVKSLSSNPPHPPTR